MGRSPIAPSSSSPSSTKPTTDPASAHRPASLVWSPFVGVSLAGGNVTVGHNGTRPPPCMRWRGPCSTCRSRLGRLTWQHRLRRADRRGQPPASGSGFPAPSAFPGVSPWAVPVSDVDVFLLLGPQAAQGAERGNLELFRYPQNSGGYPLISGVIHRFVHSISTGHRRYGAAVGGQREARDRSRKKIKSISPNGRVASRCRPAGCLSGFP